MTLWEEVAYYGKLMARKAEEARDLLGITWLNSQISEAACVDAAMQALEAENRLEVIIPMRCQVCHESMKLMVEEELDPVNLPNQKKRTWRCGCCHRQYQDVVLIDEKG
ncbi:MAG: hypothetical protein ABIH46_02955, partial [Chloroflexota bacterium]